MVGAPVAVMDQSDACTSPVQQAQPSPRRRFALREVTNVRGNDVRSVLNSSKKKGLIYSAQRRKHSSERGPPVLCAQTEPACILRPVSPSLGEVTAISGPAADVTSLSVVEMKPGDSSTTTIDLSNCPVTHLVRSGQAPAQCRQWLERATRWGIYVSATLVVALVASVFLETQPETGLFQQAQQQQPPAGGHIDAILAARRLEAMLVASKRGREARAAVRAAEREAAGEEIMVAVDQVSRQADSHMATALCSDVGGCLKLLESPASLSVAAAAMACNTLRDMADGGSGPTSSTMAGWQISSASTNGIDIVVNAMKHFEQASAVQAAGAQVLGVLARTAYDGNAAAILSAGGVDAVVLAMQAMHGDAKLQRHGCAALRNLAFDDHVEAAIGRAGGITVVVRALWLHRDNALPSRVETQALHKACYGALHNLGSAAGHRTTIRQVGAELLAGANHQAVDGVLSDGLALTTAAVGV